MAKNSENIGEQEKKVKSRLEYLYDKFNVVNPDDYIEDEDSEHGEVTYINEDDHYEYKMVPNIGFLRWDKEKGKKPDILINGSIFEKIVKHDPTPTKEYTQWMLNKLVSMIKGKKRKDGGFFGENDAERFVKEDLPQAYEYLQYFDQHKGKKKFKKLSKNSTTLSHITDPSDINQYDDLGQIFDAVEPFLESDGSNLEELMKRYEEAEEGKIEFKDRFFTVFVPLSQEACTIFRDIASWCNVKADGSMFESYTKGYKKPDGSDSKLYIVISNETLKGNDKDLYQLHFQSGQFKSQKNEMGANIDVYENIMEKSRGIQDYFYNELVDLIELDKAHKGKQKIDSLYIKDLFEFGFTDHFPDLIDKGEMPFLRMNNTSFKKLPDLTKFKDELVDIMISNNDLKKIDPSIGNLEKLKFLIIRNTELKEIPDSISGLKNLELLTLLDNDELKYIPDSISELDRSKGGKLKYLSIDNPYYIEKFKYLLPNTYVGEKINLPEFT